MKNKRQEKKEEIAKKNQQLACVQLTKSVVASLSVDFEKARHWFLATTSLRAKVKTV